MALARLGLFSMFGLLIGLGFYLIPTIVAATRKPVNMSAAIIVNIFLGWSFIGWIIALVLALGTTQRTLPYPYPRQQYQPPGAYQQAGVYQPPGAYHQGYGAAAQQPYALPAAQSTPPPAWGTPSPQQYSSPPGVSDAPYGATQQPGQPYGTPPPPA